MPPGCPVPLKIAAEDGSLEFEACVPVATRFVLLGLFEGTSINPDFPTLALQ